MLEQNSSKLALLELADNCPRTRMFRNNTGMFYQGEIIHRDNSILTMKNWRPVDCGLVAGACDYIGWTSVVITPDMVGQTIARFDGLEFKNASKHKKAANQITFIENLRRAGGRAGFAISGQDAINIINGL